MSSWLLLTLGLITFANRFVFLAQTVRFTPSSKIKQFLSYSSFAVLTAIWTPLVFKLEADSGLQAAGYDYLIAAAAAAGLTILGVRSIFVVLACTGLFFLLRFAVFA